MCRTTRRIAFLFSAMRHHASALSDAGWNVRYTQYDNPKNTGSLYGEIERAAKDLAIKEDSSSPRPGEFRLKEALTTWASKTHTTLDMPDDDRFICSHQEFRDCSPAAWSGEGPISRSTLPRIVAPIGSPNAPPTSSSLWDSSLGPHAREDARWLRGGESGPQGASPELKRGIRQSRDL